MPSTLLLAALVCAPALYDAFIEETMDPATALMRFLVAVPVCGLMLAGLNVLTRSYHQAQLDQREKAEAAEREMAAADRDAERQAA
jgi:hypothetical protein